MNISELLISIVNKVKELKPFKSAVNSVYSWLEERVRGSEDGTIPTIELPKPKDAENIVENLSVLNSRDVFSGCYDENGNNIVPEGSSFIRLENSVNKIVKLVDNNRWVLNRSLPKLPNLKSAILGITSCVETLAEEGKPTGAPVCFDSSPQLEELHFPFLEKYVTKSYKNRPVLVQGAKIKYLEFPVLQQIGGWVDYADRGYGFICHCNELKKINFPKLYKIGDGWSDQGNIIASCEKLNEITMPSLQHPNQSFIISYCPNLKKLIFGTLLSNIRNAYSSYASFLLGSSLNLIHFEIGKDSNTTLNIEGWLATNALITEDLYENITNEDGTITSTLVAKYNSLVEEGEPFKNNLEKFLYNFQHYIADRVIDRTGQKTLTLTLSTPVYEALENQEGQTILATLTAKNWTVAQK